MSYWLLIFLKVQKLTLEAEEAVRSREDAEIKCQIKIADMVALMEKHKVQRLSLFQASLGCVCA